jgi:hypothetical protein
LYTSKFVKTIIDLFLVAGLRRKENGDGAKRKVRWIFDGT